MKSILVILAAIASYFTVTNLGILNNSIHKNKSDVKEKIQIEVWSDIVCPFCFLGKKKLEQAISRLNAEDQVEITFRSFQLTPDFPKNQSKPSSQYYEEKGFAMASMKQMSIQLEQKGKDYGINYNFDNTLLFNSYDAHRLLKWADEQGKGNELKSAFFKEYFTNGNDLSKKDVLCGIVNEMGLDPKKALEILESNAYGDQVAKDINRANELRISGVPFFLINGQERISGAQDDQVFESMIKNAINR